jgi:CBS domain-containing protein
MEITAPYGSYLTPSFGHATVGDAMRPRVMTCAPDTPLLTVAQTMATEHVHAIVLLCGHDGERHPPGIVTDRDVLRAAPVTSATSCAGPTSANRSTARPTAW